LLPVLWDSPALGQFATFRRERAGLRLSQAEGVLDNRFVLVNRTFEFAERLNWHREDIRRETPLAGFELHYQSHLEDLALAWERTRDRRYVAKWQELIRSWIRGNPPQGPDFARFSWSPYVIAERVRNWLSSGFWMRAALTAELRKTIDESLAQQIAFLANNLESHLQANHLLQNLCALAVGTCFLGGDGTEAMRRRVLSRLARVAEAQVLADGMHEERSFSYHIKALADLLEVLICTPGEEGTGGLRDCAGRMAAVVASTLSEVGDLPLMNDSQEIPQEAAEWVTARASEYASLPRPSAAARCSGSGYLAGRTGPWSAVFDVGPPGPGHQLGHAHADHLSFELWYRGSKLICDSGNATYTRGVARQWYRSTAAHNTVRLDGEDSLETWGAFRVGRRPKRQTGRILSSGDSTVRWAGAHDAYRHLHGSPVHERFFCMNAGGVCVLDSISGKADHSVESFLHFHPAIVLEAIRGEGLAEAGIAALRNAFPQHGPQGRFERAGWRWRFDAPGTAGGGLVVALWPAGIEATVEEGSGGYAPAFSTEEQAAFLRLSARCALPVRLGWLMSDDASCGCGPTQPRAAP